MFLENTPNQPVVSICMITYNHEKYIKEAIEGVLMQETDFEIELIISNDCSTDGTHAVIQDICQSHARGFTIRYYNQEKNLGMMPNFIFALEQCNGKYIAICEGDDYWIDSLKLHKQVKFLEDNSSYSSCFTNIDVLNNTILKREALKTKHKKNFDSLTVFNDLWIPTLTLLFRKKSLNFPLPSQFSEVVNGDLFLFYLLAQEGLIGYIDFVSGVYRQHEDGVWTGADFLTQSENRLKTYSLVKHYFSTDRVINKIFQEKIIFNKWLKIIYFLEAGEYKFFFKHYIVFFKNYPISGINKGLLLTKKIVLKYIKRRF